MSSNTTLNPVVDSGAYRHFNLSNGNRYGFKWVELRNGDVAFLHKFEATYDHNRGGTQAIMYGVGVHGMQLSYHLGIASPKKSEEYSLNCSEELYQRRWESQQAYYYESPKDKDLSFGEITETQGKINFSVLLYGVVLKSFSYNPVSGRLMV